MKRDKEITDRCGSIQTTTTYVRQVAMFGRPRRQISSIQRTPFQFTRIAPRVRAPPCFLKLATRNNVGFSTTASARPSRASTTISATILPAPVRLGGLNAKGLENQQAARERAEGLGLPAASNSRGDVMRERREARLWTAR